MVRCQLTNHSHCDRCASRCVRRGCFWSIIGLLVGQCFGAAVMALHAAQGPKLGLPQMISSRVQFGVYGACIPIILVCLMYIGFTATGEVLAGKAIAHLAHVSNTTGILIYASLIILFATIGYRLIHLVGKVASIIGLIAFVIILTQIFALSDFSELLAVRHFSWSSFLLAVSFLLLGKSLLVPMLQTILDIFQLKHLHLVFLGCRLRFFNWLTNFYELRRFNRSGCKRQFCRK